MKIFVLVLGFWSLGIMNMLISQDVRFSFEIDNRDPIISVVRLYAQCDAGNCLAYGYTSVFYYNAGEASSVEGDVDFGPTLELGWLLGCSNYCYCCEYYCDYICYCCGYTTYTNVESTNPQVPILFTHRILIEAFDGFTYGTYFNTTPTLLATIRFNKTPGNPLTGGDVFIGATADTDPSISYNGYPVIITGERQGLLPVRLLSFEAKKSGTQDASLSWVTTNEENTSHFMIQRSLDLKSWVDIGNVSAAGYNLGLKQYNFVDAEVYNGLDSRLTAYYRLDMVDLDGRSKLSPIESVVFGSDISSGGEMTVYPNPASDGIQIEWDANTPNPPTLLEFYDLNGKRIYTRNIEEQNNQKYIDFSKTTIQPGLYMLRIINGEGPIDDKLIVVGRS